MRELGERLKILRKEANITQSDLAEKLNVHLQTISKWERGVSEPDIAQMGEFAKIINVSLEKLCGVEENGQTYDGNFSAENLGALIASLRTAKNESQEQLAAALDTSADAISRWERGITCPDIEKLISISKYYNLPISKLYYGIIDAPQESTVIRKKKNKQTILLWLTSLFGVLSLCALLLVIFLPKNPQSQPLVTYTVILDGKEYEVNQDDWFIPQPEIRAGYDFIGLKTAEGEDVTTPCKITSNCEFICVYKPCEYNIDYWLNGGNFKSSEAHTVFTVESGEIALPVPEKSGAIFEGWYFTDDYNGDCVTQISCNAENIKLYAKWSDQTFTVRYDLNGGILYAKNPTVITKDEEVTLYNPLRKDHLFLGWYDTPVGGNRFETVGGQNAKNITLYAVWQKCDVAFSITYELNGGTQNINNPETAKAGEFVELYAPARTGYNFVGWNESADGSGEFVQSLYGLESDIVLYAVYAPKQYLIRYEYEGIYLTDEVNPNYITFGESVALIPVYRYGYKFLGWYDGEKDGNLIETVDESNLYALSTLYARFEIITYRVDLDGDGGVFITPEGERSSYSYEIPFNGNLELPEAFKDGYEFIGYQNEAGESVTQLNALNLADMNLTALWREKNKTYNITFETAGGELQDGNVLEVMCGDTVILPVPERSGYLFLGWNDESDESGSIYNATDPLWHEDLTLYAMWQEIKVNGSSELFNYEKGADAVTITDYRGDYGENVDLVFPSYIEGLPVKSIEWVILPLGVNKFSPYWTFRSVYIPEGVQYLGEEVFKEVSVLQPLVIPASVIEIGAECFEWFMGEVYFAEGSQIETINTSVFKAANIANVLVLPSTVKTIKRMAFNSPYISGLVLPEGLTTIMDYGCRITGSLYLPSTLKYFGDCAVTKAYVSISKEEGTDLGLNASYNWTIVYNHTAHAITLRDGDGEEEYFEKYLVLPKREKQGYTFLGWQNEKGEFVSNVFIPQADSVLTAVYEQRSANDGRTQASAMIVKPNESFQITVRSGEMIYLMIDTPKDVNCTITVNNNLKLTYDILLNKTVKQNEEFSYTAGTVIPFNVSGIPSSAILTVTVLSG